MLANILLFCFLLPWLYVFQIHTVPSTIVFQIVCECGVGSFSLLQKVFLLFHIAKYFLWNVWNSALELAEFIHWRADSEELVAMLYGYDAKQNVCRLAALVFVFLLGGNVKPDEKFLQSKLVSFLILVPWKRQDYAFEGGKYMFATLCVAKNDVNGNGLWCEE